MKEWGIKVSGIKKAFGQEQVLEGVDLTVSPGEILAIIGVSGTGKTTLLRLIAGLDAPHAGEIYLFGELATRGPEILIPPHQRQVGFIFQNLGLWEHMSVEEHLRFVTSAQEEIEKWLTFFGLSAYRNKRPYHLSGGQRQRLAIARALAQGTEILLLDEPFSNLDVPRKKQLRQELLRLKRERNLTLIYVTHDNLDVHLLSDRVAVLHQGRIIQTGPYEELVKNPVHPIVRELLEI